MVLDRDILGNYACLFPLADTMAATHECTGIVLKHSVNSVWRLLEAETDRPGHVEVIDWQVRLIPAPKSVAPK